MVSPGRQTDVDLSRAPGLDEKVLIERKNWLLL